ncbi:alpha/beta hydrolase [Arenimonas sp.]|uniref:alpha/beta hydrolase n=1 Tax=Arenimonas sp. TaxID=1872635 RepID=UPI0035B047B3
MAGEFRGAVFVHGAGGGGWEWAAWARVFSAAGIAVAAPDLRPAAAGLAETTLADYSMQVSHWLDAVPRPRVLVGASLGGLLAAMSADRADALVLVNPMPPGGLPAAPASPPVVPWGRRASLEGTRRALPGADDAAALFAFRRWRDESGAALDQARAGVALARPAVPVLLLISEADRDVPSQVSLDFAKAWDATAWRIPGGHVDPLLGRGAPTLAHHTLTWLKMGSENINVSNTA